MQVFNDPPPQESEDCLYLNVYAPATPPPEGGRTVMFWIYGGALQFGMLSYYFVQHDIDWGCVGNAGQQAYDGSSFSAYQDIIVVAPNYRTNGMQGTDSILNVVSSANMKLSLRFLRLSRDTTNFTQCWILGSALCTAMGPR